MLEYQGRMFVAGKPYDGQGHFSFLVVDGLGEVLWSSGQFPKQKTTRIPPGVVSRVVSNGFYSVRLGDTAAGMPALDLAALSNAFAPKLRVWFNDGRQGWQPTGDDVSLDAALGKGDEGRGNSLDKAATSAILRELKEMRMLLERQRPGPAAVQAQPERLPQVTVAMGDGPSLGKTNAPLVLVEFTDFQCPFCRRFQETVLPSLVKTYVDTGQLRMVSRNMTLPFHAQAEPAARAALCAHEQQAFWPMRELLFSSNTPLTASNFISAAEALKLDVNAFRVCLENGEFAEQLKRDGDAAKSAGITGTPSFVLGKASNGQVTGSLIVGARAFAEFDAEVKRLLNSTE